jgi:hypothetical protein
MNGVIGICCFFINNSPYLFCVHSPDSIPCLLGYSKTFHELHNDFWNTNIHYFGFSWSYSERNIFLCFIYVQPLTRCPKFLFTWHCSRACACVCLCFPPHPQYFLWLFTWYIFCKTGASEHTLSNLMYFKAHYDHLHSATNKRWPSACRCLRLQQ